MAVHSVNISDPLQMGMYAGIGAGMGYVSALILPTVTPVIGGLVMGSLAVVYPIANHFLGPLNSNETSTNANLAEKMLKTAKLIAAFVAICGIPAVLGVFAGYMASIPISIATCLVFELQTGFISSLALLVVSTVENMFANMRASIGI